MDPFTLQRSIFRQIRTERPSMEAGMALTLDRLSAAPHGKVWSKCTGIDWQRGQRRWIKWFDDLLKKHPVPRDTQLLWFEVPSELNPALTSVSAYQRLGPRSESYGLDEPRTWPASKKGFTLPAGLHELPELETALLTVNWQRTSSDDDEKLLPAVYAISYAYAALLVFNGLPEARILDHIDAPDVAAILGWAEGDLEPVGQLTRSGWKPIRGVRAASKSPRPEELDPDSVFFNVKKYLAAGKDLEARDKSGATVLMRNHWSEFRIVKELVESGADVNATSRDGSGVLHRFAAAKLPILQLLLEAGADPTLVNDKGTSVLDAVAQDGRCTLKHLHLLTEAGAQLHNLAREGKTPIQDLAESGIYQRSRRSELTGMLDFWLRQGYDINDSCPGGLSPLWVALRAHAEELKENLDFIRSEPDAIGTWDYKRDEVAMMLLDRGADPNARYPGRAHRYIPAGATPLMVQRYDDDRLVRALLKHGADPAARCAKGKTALDYAEKAAADKRRIDCKGAEAVAQVLRRAMSRNQAAAPRKSAKSQQSQR